MSAMDEIIPQPDSQILSTDSQILVVDDEDVLRGVIAEVLRRQGNEVTEATFAEDALAEFEKHRYPVVVTDIIMGEMNGLDLLREIKKVDRDFKKVEEGERDKKGFTYRERTQTAERKAAEKITSTSEKRKMEPRGWMYFAPGTGGQRFQRVVTGSLTCSAIASSGARTAAEAKWRAC